MTLKRVSVLNLKSLEHDKTFPHFTLALQEIFLALKAHTVYFAFGTQAQGVHVH